MKRSAASLDVELIDEKVRIYFPKERASRNWFYLIFINKLFIQMFKASRIENTINIFDLPSDVIVKEIFSYLKIFEIFLFSLSCKSASKFVLGGYKIQRYNPLEFFTTIIGRKAVNLVDWAL